MTNRDEANTVFKQRPRVTIQIPSRTYEIEPHQPSPFIPLTGASSIPNVEANPFLQALYAQKAGDFMSKQFEGLNRFTKSGLSVGEKSVVWLYTKFRKLSKKWFTHIFLFLVVTLYSIAGAFLFMAIEGLYIKYCFSFKKIYLFLIVPKSFPSFIYEIVTCDSHFVF